ncbi:MAG: type 4a pilus biogenesis protein PilO [bacterium]|nr:type 4a pilus biogenesis protein PilO [bacterium]
MGNKFVPLGIIIIAILALVTIKPYAFEVRATNAKIQAFREQTKRTQDKINKLNDLKPTLEEYKTKIDDLRLAMPASQQIPEVLVMVEAIARDTGLTISGLDIQPGSDEGEVGVNMSAVGSYDNLSYFTAKLEKNLRPIRIKSMSLSSSAGDSQLSVAVSYGIQYQGINDQQVAEQID